MRGGALCARFLIIRVLSNKKRRLKRRFCIISEFSHAATVSRGTRSYAGAPYLLPSASAP